MKDKFYLFIQFVVYLFSIFIGGGFLLLMCFIWLVFAAIVLFCDILGDLFGKRKGAR